MKVVPAKQSITDKQKIDKVDLCFLVPQKLCSQGDIIISIHTSCISHFRLLFGVVFDNILKPFISL